MATVDATVKVSCEEPPAVMGFVPNPTVTPVGKPEAERVMELAYPPKMELETVDVPVAPC